MHRADRNREISCCAGMDLRKETQTEGPLGGKRPGAEKSAEWISVQPRHQETPRHLHFAGGWNGLLALGVGVRRCYQRLRFFA